MVHVTVSLALALCALFAAGCLPEGGAGAGTTGTGGSSAAGAGGSGASAGSSAGGFGGTGGSLGGTGGVSGPCSDYGLLECGPSSASGAAPVMFCDGMEYSQVFSCPLGEECTDVVGGMSVNCGSDEVGYAYESKPCSAEGKAACTFDAGTVLTCQSGYWTAKESCAGACGKVPPGWSDATSNCPLTATSGCITCV